jgi:serine/threonine protein phosphatase PrpC
MEPRLACSPRVPPSLLIAHALAFAGASGDDRVALIEHQAALVVVVADGVGGVSGGACAAELLVERVRQAVAAPGFDAHLATSWVELLTRADLALEADARAGETTGLVLAASERGVVGASCGDSRAWLIAGDGAIDDLTAGQQRKLRLGSGRARPVPFTRPRLDGKLLAATDGLFDYAPPARISDLARGADLDAAAQQLSRLVRLPGGALQDDVGLVLVRRA